MNALIEQINSTGKIFIDFALPMLIQSSVLIVILLALDMLLRKRIRAVFRYWIWMIVLVKLILPPSLSLPTSPAYWFSDKIINSAQNPPIQEKPATYSFSNLEISLPSNDFTTIEYRPEPAFNSEELAATPPVIPKIPLSWQAIAFLSWLAVSCMMFILLIQRTFFVKRLINQSQIADEKLNDILEKARLQMSLKKKVVMRLSDTAMSPSVCGLFKPVILIPQKLVKTISSNDLKAILLHELAHIKRNDLLVNLVQAILQIIYIYNPLLWIANIVIRNVREQAVDEMVLVAMGEHAEEYPKTLLNISRLSFGSAALSLRLIGVAESKKALITRIKHITSRPFPKTVKLGITGLTAIILAAFVLIPMAKAQRENQPDNTNTITQDKSDNTNEESTEAESGIDTNFIEVSLVPEKTSFMLGEPIYISFIVENKSEDNLQVIVGGDYRNALGRLESFTIITIDKNGNEVPQPDAGMSHGGLIGPQKLPSKGQYEFRLFLPNWATFEKTGSYTITAQRTLQLLAGLPNANWFSNDETTDLKAQASATIEVVPLDKEKMGMIIEQLGQEMLNAKDDPAEDAAKRLTNIQDERVVPYFIKAVETSPYSIKFISLNALSKFDSDEAFEALKYGLNVTGKDFISRATTMEVADSLAKNIKLTAINAISKSPHPDAIDFLLSKRNDEMYEIRLTVVHTLGRMNVGKAVPILKEMQNDKNETIRSEVKRYLEKFESEKTQSEITKQFTAALPNGVTVELVGVCEHPSEGKQWWRADGTKLEKAPYEKLERIVESDESSKIREIAIHFSGQNLKDANYRTHRIEGQIQTTYSNSLSQELMAIIATFSKNKKIISIPIGVSTGQWETQMVSDGKREISIALYGGEAIFRQATETNGKSRISVMAMGILDDDGRQLWENRITAKDSKGNVLTGKSISGAIRGRTGIDAYEFERPLEQIDSFEFQIRPYYWIEFENVAIETGNKTDVQIRINKAGTNPQVTTVVQMENQPVTANTSSSSIVLEGTITDTEGKPASYNISVLGGGMNTNISTRSSQDGKFEYSNLPVGEYSFSCNPLNQSEPRLLIRTVEILKDKKTILNVNLKCYYSFSGKVTYEDGSPVVGMEMMAECEDKQMIFSNSVKTDGQGRYTLSVPLKTTVRAGLRIMPDDYTTKEGIYNGFITGREDIDFVLIKTTESSGNSSNYGAFFRKATN